MNDKVRIGEHDDTAAEIKAANEAQRADTAVRELSAMRRRVHQFYQAVHFVAFEDPDATPSWAPEWFDYLLDGAVPEPVDPDALPDVLIDEKNAAPLPDEYDDEASGD